MKPLLSLLLALGVSLALSPAHAETTQPAAKKSVKKSAKTKAKAKTAAATTVTTAPSDEDEPIPDITTSNVRNYQCPENKSIAVYRNASDEKHAALRWNNTLYGMRRIPTESGAERLESHKYGLVFIGIPAKSMLLDTKKGHPLINDCVTSDINPLIAEKPVATDKPAEQITVAK